MLEVAEVRRRLRQRIERARAAEAARRARIDAARGQYDAFLAETATPMFRMFSMALRAEGHPFEVATPAGAVRLTGPRRENYIELGLDTSGPEPAVVGRSSRGRGRQVVTSERPLRDGAPIEALTQEDVLEFLLAEIEEFVV